jgi:hypothetical protein
MLRCRRDNPSHWRRGPNSRYALGKAAPEVSVNCRSWDLS